MALKAPVTTTFTPKQFAAKHGLVYSTVMKWLREDRIVGAVKKDLPFGGFVYEIPQDAEVPGKRQPGRVPKLKPQKEPAKRAKK